MLLAGCGLAANPQPPTLWLPAPVKDLSATRAGDLVELHWTMPRNTTDKVALKGDQRAHFCWEAPAAGSAISNAGGTAAAPAKTAGKRTPAAVAAPEFDAKACKPAGDGMFPPEKPADFKAKIPRELTSGIPRVVGFYVLLENHAGKTAGASNAAWIATGAPPPPVTGLRLETRTAGVVLHWQTAATETAMVLRIHRTLADKPGVEKPNQASGAPPAEGQVLEVDLDRIDPGEALDHDAPLDHEWNYSVQRVLKVNIEKHALEIAGQASETVGIDAKDIFPPAIPGGLAAVVDEQARAIDLSWAPDTDADLAGYVVYRRDVTAATAMERISGTAPVASPSFSDTRPVAGHRYAYAVSAVDQDGNESERSGDVEEQLPQ